VNAGDAAEEDRKRVEDNFVSGPGGTMAPRAWTGWRAGAEFAERRKKVGEEELVRRARGVLDPLARRLKGGYFFDR
jgi:sorting and assembly machinery component 37